MTAAWHSGGRFARLLRRDPARAERVALGHPTGQRFAHYRAQTVSAMNRHSNLTNTTRNRVEI